MILKVLFNPNHSIHAPGADGAQGTGIVEFHPLEQQTLLCTPATEKAPKPGQKATSGPLLMTRGHSRIT